MKIKVTLTRVTSQDIHTESSFDILDYQVRCNINKGQRQYWLPVKLNFISKEHIGMRQNG